MFGISSRQLFWLLMLAGALFAGAQYVPAYFKAFQFNDFIRGEAKYAAGARRTTDQLRASISEKAKEMEIPIKPKDIRITRRGPAFQLDLDYSFPIDLRVYRHDLKFHVSESGEMFDKK